MYLPKSILYPLVILFTLGGVFSFYFEITSIPLFSSLGFTLIFYFLLKEKRTKLLKSGVLYFSFLLLGYIHFQEYYRLPKTHYQHHTLHDADALKRIEIKKALGINSYSFSFQGEVKQWGNNPVVGKILLYQSRDSLTTPYQIGQEILTRTKTYSIKSNRNPGEFSYKNYLSNSKVYQQIQVDESNAVLYIEKPKTPFFDLIRLRERVETKIKTSSLTEESKGMLNALLLGKRKALGEEILTAYTHAGVIHLLALSGLHVGLLVLILMYLLKPLVKLKFGKSIRFGILLFFLWSFAFFVGLVPSVVRSVTLFSFIVIGNYINQGKHSFHYTMLSFFVLLICYPPFLRSIGFQLSYLAVFGILAIRPLFLQLWNPSPILYKRFWELITVSLAAQIAVSPISIYYFHQFPSLFLLSNLIILPFFGLFLSFSLVVLLLLIIGYSIPNIFQFYEIWVTFLNQIVFWIAQQETFLFDRIYNSTVSTLLTYAIILSGLLFFYKKAFSRGVVFLIFSLLFISNLVMETKKEETVNCFWIFHQHKESVMGHQKGRYLYYSSTDEENSNRILTDFITSRRLKNKKTLSIKNSYKQRDFKLLLLNKKHPIEIKQLAPTHILLQNNVKVNLDLLLEEYKPKLLIADGSNDPWFSARWEKTCKKYNVRFYDTRKNGALKINLENEG